jgi:hypothetical protein
MFDSIKAIIILSIFLEDLEVNLKDIAELVSSLYLHTLDEISRKRAQTRSFSQQEKVKKNRKKTRLHFFSFF